ncbi:MAG: hypothetical protein ACK56F_27775, partial [bacterium]
VVVPGTVFHNQLLSTEQRSIISCHVHETVSPRRLYWTRSWIQGTCYMTQKRRCGLSFQMKSTTCSLDIQKVLHDQLICPLPAAMLISNHKARHIGAVADAAAGV